MLNEAPKRNDATGVANNVRLTTMGTIQFSKEAVGKTGSGSGRSADKIRRLGDQGYMPSGLGGRSISVERQAVR